MTQPNPRTRSTTITPKRPRDWNDFVWILDSNKYEYVLGYFSSPTKIYPHNFSISQVMLDLSHQPNRIDHAEVIRGESSLEENVRRNTYKPGSLLNVDTHYQDDCRIPWSNP
jgi:hypothetical protein